MAVDVAVQRGVVAVVVLADVLAELERLVDDEVARDDVADLARVDVARPVVGPGEVLRTRRARRRCPRRSRSAVWYSGVPSSSKASAEKMNGEAPYAVSGKPASASASVVTSQIGMPTTPRTLFSCGLVDRDRHADAVRSCRWSTSTVGPADAVRSNSLAAAIARPRAVASVALPLIR